MIKGSERYLARPVKKMRPISPRLLACLCSVTPFGSPLRCLFLMLFYTFLRLGSVIPAGGRQLFSRDSHLVWGDVSFREGKLVLIVRKTKTIQCNERRLKFIVPELENKSLCLVQNLLCWKSSLGSVSVTDPVFLCSKGGFLSPMTRSMVTPAYKGALARVGVNPESFGWSSFRRGAATAYFVATGDVEILKAQGDWVSNAYREYLSLSAGKRSGIPRTLLGRL